MSHALHRTEEFWDTATGSIQQVCAEVQVLQILQRKQGRTYLAGQIWSEGVSTSKSKLVDVASSVAASDASPPAAVLLVVATVSPPRAEDAVRVAGDAVLECQQGVPLVWYAARARSVTTGGWLELLLLLRGEEQAAAAEQHEHGSS